MVAALAANAAAGAISVQSARRQVVHKVLCNKVVVSQNRGPQYGPHHITIFIMGTLKKVPIKFRKLPTSERVAERRPLLRSLRRKAVCVCM